MNDHKQFTRGYVKGWTDRHNHGDELPTDLSNAINELQRLLNREEVELPPVKARKPLYVSGGNRFSKASRARWAKSNKPGDTETSQYVWEAVKAQLVEHGAMMPIDITRNLLDGTDARIKKYILGSKQRLGQLLIYYAKIKEPQVRRVSAGYELVNGGTQ